MINKEHIILNTIKQIGILFALNLSFVLPIFTAQAQNESAPTSSPRIDSPIKLSLEERYPFLATQMSRAHFKPFGVGEMPNETITDIVQGADGFIWVSSEAGLVRFDGGSFKAIPPKLDANGNPLDPQFNLINPDPYGRIWITANEGFQIYNSRLEKFDESPLIETEIIDALTVDLLLFDDYGTWVIFRNDEQTVLGMINRSGSLRQWPLQNQSGEDKLYSFAGNDDKGNLWFWTENEKHIIKFNSADFSKTLIELSFSESFLEQDSPATVDEKLPLESVQWFEIIDGQIPLIQVGNVITRFDPNTGQIPSDTASVTHPELEDAVFRDTALTPDNKIWLATNSHGLFEIAADLSTIKQHTPSDNSPYALPGYTVTSLLVDRFGMLWCGTFNGVFLVDPGRNAIATFSKANNYLENSDAIELLKTDRNELWVGHSNGVDVIDLENGSREIYSPYNEDNYSPSEASALAETTDGSIYLGSQFSESLYKFNPDKKLFEIVENFDAPEFSGGLVSLYSLDNNGLLISSFRGLVYGRNDKFQILGEGTLGQTSGMTKLANNQHLIAQGPNGLYLFNSETLEFSNITPTELEGEIIIDINSLGDGSVWAVSRLGAHQLELTQNSLIVRAHIPAEKLPSNQYASILADFQGNVWVGSQGGVFRIRTGEIPISLNSDNEFEVNYFGRDQGFHWSTYFVSAAIRIDENLIGLGSTGGAIIFSPERFSPNEHAPQIYISELQRFNRSVVTGKSYDDRVILNKPLFRTNELELEYTDSVISFRFAAMHTRTPSSNRLWYQMEGIDPDWNETPPDAVATYTSLPPGNYTFKVRAQSGDGVEVVVPQSLAVRVKPAWWESWVIRTISSLLLFLAVLILFHWRTRLIRDRASVLQYEVHEATADLAKKNKELIIAREKAEAATEERTQFLANMSHEIRTPINGVIGMTSLLGSSPLNKEQKSYLDTVRSSGEALLSIINEILDFSKIEAGEVRLDIQSVLLEKCVFDAVGTVTPLACDKGLNLIVNFSADCLTTLKTDEQRLRQALLNLLSNAVKFTSSGEVTVNVDLETSSEKDSTAQLILAVADTGIGIESEKLSLLFNPFTQADASTTRKYGGTGLGLSITKNLIEMLGGKLSVKSAPDSGSVFTISLPIEYALADSSEQLAAINEKRIAVLLNSDSELRSLDHTLTPRTAKVDYFHSHKDLEQHLGNSHVDIVIVDESISQVTEPNESGLQALFNEISSPPPVIYLASLNNQSAVIAQHSTVLRKPVSPSKLLLEISNQLSPIAREVSNPDTVQSLDFSELEILIAEDNKVNQLVAKKVIATLGCDADIAENGIQALEMANRKDYDIVFMDIQMPEMDGIEATSKLRSSKLKQPYIIAMTANVQNEDKQRCMEIGMNDFIAKPIRIEDIQQAITKAVAQQ